MFKKLFGDGSKAETFNAVPFISGNNKPTMILVDLVCSKILLNLDNIDFKEIIYNDRDGTQAFSWKVDDIVAAATRVLKVTTRYDSNSGKGVPIRTAKLDHFSIEPIIRINSESYKLTKEEKAHLWETMVRAGRMKIKRDIEREEYNRQRLAVEAIAAMGGRESDIVKRAKELSEKALLKLAPPEKSVEEKLEERINADT